MGLTKASPDRTNNTADLFDKLLTINEPESLGMR
jgi:hypothetical protein